MSKDATIAAIRSAHRKLVLQTHPDKVQDESLRAAKQDEFQRIQQAYEILSDETQRQQYDEQVRASRQKREFFADRPRGGTTQFEVRTAAPSREYDRVYEERRARRSFEDDLGPFRVYDEKVAPGRYDSYSYRRPSRSYDERKAARAAEDERERTRIERDRQRQSEREYQSERRRTRDKDRRRGYDEKYAPRVDPYDDEDEENRYRSKVDVEDAPRRKSGDVRRSHARSSEEQVHKETTEKLSSTREYILKTVAHSPRLERAATSPYFEASPPPVMADDTVRRSSARRSVDRERRRGSTRSTPSRKNSGNDRIEIVEPAADEPQPKIVPSMTPSVSSPSNFRIPSTPRMSPQTHRSATMQGVHEVCAEPPPPLSRSSTMPSSPSTSRRERVPLGSSKLKPSVTEVDSGYSSPGTPDTPHLGSRLASTPLGYFVIGDQDSGHRYRIVEEPAYVPRERSISPHTRGRSSEHARPCLARETSGSTRLSPGRTTSYVYRREGSSTRRAEPVLHRKEASSSTRGPASFLRSESSGHHSRRLYGEVKYAPKDVQYAHRIGVEDILFADRRGSEAAYRDAAPYSSRSHYVYGPHPGLMRAETST